MCPSFGKWNQESLTLLVKEHIAIIANIRTTFVVRFKPFLGFAFSFGFCYIINYAKRTTKQLYFQKNIAMAVSLDFIINV